MSDLLGALRGCRSNFLVPRLRLVNLRIFHGGSLMVSFIALCRSFAMVNALVHFLEYKREQETSLNLDIDSFLHQLFLII